MDVAEAELGELPDRPIARPRLRLGPGLALPDLGGEAFEKVPGDRIAIERGIAQLGGAVGPRLGGGEGGQGGGEEEEEEEELFHGGGPSRGRSVCQSRFAALGIR